MQKWEYRTITAEIRWESTGRYFTGNLSKAGLDDAELTHLGNDGWELVGFAALDLPAGLDGSGGGARTIQYIFKRPKP